MNLGPHEAEPSLLRPPTTPVISRGFDGVRFVENFEALSEARGGIQKLRQLILGLALSGELSGPHDRKAEPGPDRHWRRVRLDAVADCVLGKMLDKAKHTKGTKRPYLRNINVRWGAIDLSDLLEMNFENDELERYGVRNGDVLICEGGEPGRAAVWRDSRPMLIQKAIHRVRPSMALLPTWLVMNLRYDTWTGRLAAFFTGVTIKHFTGKALAGYTIPLPPRGEQERIVAKVDQLMALCDDLEARQTQKHEIGTRLTKSALEALTTAESPAEFDTAWKRVAENFDVLLRNSADIEQLRQAVLWLATHGRLVDRVPAEGTGEILLEHTRSESRRRWETSKIEEMRDSGIRPKNDSWKTKYVPAAATDGSDALVASLPGHWSAGSLEELAEVIDPNPSHRYPTYRDGVIPLLSTREFRGRDGWDASGSKVPLVPLEVHKEQNARCRFSARDIVLARKGRLGLARHPPPLKAFVFSHTVFVVKPADAIDADYLLWYLRLDRVVTWLRGEMNDNTGVPTLGKATTERLPVPLPPLGEQKRIVAKVERLLKVCDDLEACLRRAEERAANLVEAAVQELGRDRING